MAHWITGGAVTGPAGSRQHIATCSCGWGPHIFITGALLDIAAAAHVRAHRSEQKGPGPEWKTTD